MIISKWCFISAIFLMILSWLNPNHYSPWLASHSDFLAFLALFFMIIATILYSNRIDIPKIFIYFFIFTFIPIFQFLTGIIFFFGDALIASLYLFGFFIASTIGYNLAKNPIIKDKTYCYFYAAILFASLVSVYIALQQWLLLSNGSIWQAYLPQNARPFANFAQPNTLSTFLLMGCVSTLYFYEKHFLSKFSINSILFILILGLALTQSRTVWVTIPCMLIWWFWKGYGLNAYIRKSIIITWVLIYTVMIILLPMFSNRIGVTSVSTIMDRASTGHNRIEIWQQMLIAIQNHPWFGWGWNQVAVAQVETTLEYPVKEWVEHSHNIILDLIVWNGIPIGIFIIIFILIWLYRLSILVKSIDTLLALMMSGCILVHAMFEFPIEYAFFLLPLGFLLGTVQAEEQRGSVIAIPKPLWLFSIALSLILYIAIFIEYRIIETDVRQLRFESANIGELPPTFDVPPNIYLLTQLREQIRYIRTEPKSRMTSDQLELMRKVSLRFADSYTQFKYAQVLALNGNLDGALRELEIINKLHGKVYTKTSLYNVNFSLAYQWKNTKE